MRIRVEGLCLGAHPGCGGKVYCFAEAVYCYKCHEHINLEPESDCGPGPLQEVDGPSCLCKRCQQPTPDRELFVFLGMCHKCWHEEYGGRHD